METPELLDKMHTLSLSSYGDTPACNPENSCEIIQEFINDETLVENEEYDEIYRHLTLELKDQKRLMVLKTYLDDQMRDLQRELDANIEAINDLNERYLELYRKKK
jgi:hypothetical protein